MSLISLISEVWGSIDQLFVVFLSPHLLFIQEYFLTSSSALWQSCCWGTPPNVSLWYYSTNHHRLLLLGGGKQPTTSSLNSSYFSKKKLPRLFYSHINTTKVSMSFQHEHPAWQERSGVQRGSSVCNKQYLPILLCGKMISSSARWWIASCLYI